MLSDEIGEKGTTGDLRKEGSWLGGGEGVIAKFRSAGPSGGTAVVREK